MKIHTLRGQLPPGPITRELISDDGRITHGMRVKSFKIWANRGDTNTDLFAILSLNQTEISLANAGNNAQIGWATYQQTGNQTVGTFEVIDPNHTVIQDLFIHQASNEVCNYLIVLEAVELSQNEAILTMIKERSQGGLR